MLLLSWAGSPLCRTINQDNKCAFHQEAREILEGLHRLGLLHKDPALCNILRDDRTGCLMWTDLERAEACARLPLGPISPNRKRKRPVCKKTKCVQDAFSTFHIPCPKIVVIMSIPNYQHLEVICLEQSSSSKVSNLTTASSRCSVVLGRLAGNDNSGCEMFRPKRQGPGQAPRRPQFAIAPESNSSPTACSLERLNAGRAVKFSARQARCRHSRMVIAISGRSWWHRIAVSISVPVNKGLSGCASQALMHISAQTVAFDLASGGAYMPRAELTQFYSSNAAPEQLLIPGFSPLYSRHKMIVFLQQIFG